MRNRWRRMARSSARGSARGSARAEQEATVASFAGFESASLTSNKSEAGGKKGRGIIRKLGRWLAKGSQ